MTKRTMCKMMLRTALCSVLMMLPLTALPAQAGRPAGPGSAAMPHIAIAADGRRTLFVDGKPFFVLAAQLHNSSAWPAALPEAWKAAMALSPNTIEAPVYWEQVEPQPGHYDMSSVDALIAQARASHIHLILLWFGTWKNGQDHYAPLWIRTDPAHYPRMIDANGVPVDVQSPLAEKTLAADKAAYSALLAHLKAVDGDQHSVIMVQVENEPGAIGTARDHGPEAEQLFGQAVPAALVTRLGKQPGTWREIFGPDADEAFTAWSTSGYIEDVAAAGKAIYPLPVYVNCWMRYKNFTSPGIDYPSGGAVWTMLDLWKAMTPSIDMIGTDVYTTDVGEYDRAIAHYDRPDNPSWVSETGFDAQTAPMLYDVLGRGGIGFSVFGVDNPTPTTSDLAAEKAHHDNFALLAPVSQLIAQAASQHRVYAAFEKPGQARQILPLSDGWHAIVSFGPPPWGEKPSIVPNSSGMSGRVFIVRDGPDRWLVGGAAVRIEFARDDGRPMQLLRVEDGTYRDDVWQTRRWLNGDETDFGLNLSSPGLLRVSTGHL